MYVISYRDKLDDRFHVYMDSDCNMFFRFHEAVKHADELMRDGYDIKIDSFKGVNVLE